MYWDEKNIYYRQDFVTLHDNFLRATSYVKIAVVGVTAENLLLAVTQENMTLPQAPNDLLSWINYNNQNSQNLKKSV